MKTPEEFLSRGTGNFINCTDYDDAVIAIKLYAKEAINEIVKEYKLQTFNAVKNGGKLRSIDYLAIDFIEKHLQND